MRQKLTIVSPFKVWPPVSGGQIRSFNLYLYLSKWFDIEFISIDDVYKDFNRKEISNNFIETSVPITLKQQQLEKDLSVQCGTNCADIALMDGIFLNNKYVEELRRASKESVAIIVSHPYLFYIVKECTDLPIWYEAQDFEYELKKQLLSEFEGKEKILHDIYTIEQECCFYSDLIMTCSSDDMHKMSNFYNTSENKFIVVPNGSTKPSNHLATKVKSKNLVFVGSAHPPNVIAVDEILKVAKKLSDFSFHIVGSCCNSFMDRITPDNVILHGVLTEMDKNRIIQEAYIALNPMPYGSGTNLKIIDYYLNKTAVICNSIGARGLPIVDKTHLIIKEINELEEGIKELYNDDLLYKNITLNAYELAYENYTWQAISEKFYSGLLEKTSIEKNEYNLNKISYELKNEVEKVLALYSKRLYIFGAGLGGRECYKKLVHYNLDIKGFIDNDANKLGDLFENKEIFDINTIFNNYKYDNSIIIASMYSKEISKQLDKLGYVKGTHYLICELNSPDLIFV